MTTKHEIRRGAYADSVILMKVQKGLAGLPGVDDAAVVMATPANKDVLRSTGFDLTGIDVGADDLLIVVKAADEQTAAEAIAQVDGLMKQRPSGGAAGFRPKSLRRAADMLPDASWVIVSVPGRYAAAVADEALALGKHVMLYSDNVPLADEAKLKQKARASGLLVMGPDCGTAIINGVGLGFANRVQRGRIGVVGASGTGIQAITVAVHQLGGGISQAIGTGGRDLKEAVGGITMIDGIDLLAADAETDVIVIVSKPPSPHIAQAVLNAARTAGKPVVIYFMGQFAPGQRLGNLAFAQSLQEAAALAVAPQGRDGGAEKDGNNKGYLRGLFSGGTLAYECVMMCQAVLAPLYTNVPVGTAQPLADVHASQHHTIVDMGEDVFTQGRLHPMMDGSLRLRRLQKEAADPDTAVILLDVLLGDGAQADPAAELAPAIAAITQARPDIAIGIILIGTDSDPQNSDGQIDQLEQAGAAVFRSVDGAAAMAIGQLAAVTAAASSVAPLPQTFAAINVGVETFHDSLQAQGASVIQVDWRPPAGGNDKLAAILAKMKGR